MGEKILEIEGITKKYKDFKLEPVSFSLEAGRLMSVMGAYGAGKTTLFKLLTGQLRMDEGNVIFFEKGEVLEHCGFVPAEGGFPDCLNAKEISRILKGCYKNWQESYFFELADRFSLSLTRPLRELTRGAEQKVRILSALAHEPKLLILDEPTAGLELEDKELALSLFQDFAKKDGQAVLLFMEKTAEAEAISDDLAFLYKGKLIFAEEKETLKKRYGFLTASDEELEKLPRSAWRGICRTETGGSLLFEKSLLPEGMEETLLLEAPSLENIMQYLTKEAVRR